MAVVSQPYDRSALCEAPGQPDKDLGEFWETNPWNIAFRHNLSAFERNRTYLNVGGRDFLDLSHAAGADSDGDSRAAVAADFDNDGRADLALRQVGGGPLLLYRNRFGQRHWLRVSLHGTRSNRLGIGARLTAFAAGRRIVRELYPVNSFHSQAPSHVDFGLDDAAHVERLVVRWPSGTEQTFENLAADRHLVLTEGVSAATIVEPGTTIAP
jgi:enediyne biosynthesis protein E4